MRTVRATLAAILLTAIVLSGCSSGSSGSPAQPSTRSPAASAPASTVEETVATTAPAAGQGQAACTQAAILPLLKSKFDDPGNGLVIVKADIKGCRNGYAHVFAVPRQNPAGQSQFESEQLFLRSVGGKWTSVAEGTGITCEDADITPAMLQACRALGEGVAAWPTTRREAAGTAGDLVAIRTARHGTFDRVVFQFAGRNRPGYSVEYVPRVTQDPSDRPVPLRGSAFMQVVFQGASTMDVQGRKVYTGPATITPGLPTLKQIKLAGDFERVLSFGIGLDHKAGFQVQSLTGPSRVVIDVAH